MRVKDAVRRGHHFPWRQDNFRRKQNSGGTFESPWQERKRQSKIRGQMPLQSKLNHEFKVGGVDSFESQFLGLVVPLGW